MKFESCTPNLYLSVLSFNLGIRPFSYNGSRILLYKQFQFYLDFSSLHPPPFPQVLLPSCSSILSHSSNTKCFTLRRLSVLLRTNARVRPGVPTTICGQFFLSTSSSFLIESPPKKTDTCRRIRNHSNDSATHSLYNAVNNIQTQPLGCSNKVIG